MKLAIHLYYNNRLVAHLTRAARNQQKGPTKIEIYLDRMIETAIEPLIIAATEARIAAERELLEEKRHQQSTPDPSREDPRS